MSHDSRSWLLSSPRSLLGRGFRRHFLQPGVVALVLGLVCVLGGGGWLGWGATVKGSGHPVTREFDLTDFSSVAVGNAFRVTITKAEKTRVSVTVDDNLVDLLDVTRSGAELHIGLKPRVNVRNATLKAEVSLPELSRLDLSGATDGRVTGFRSSQRLEVEVSGASHLKGDVECGDARIDVSGASKVEFEGKAGSLNVKASGASSAQLERFESKDTVAEASGASHATVHAVGELDARASGASSVRYVGKPASVKSKASGASSVKPKS